MQGLDLAWCKSSDAGLPRPDLVLYLTLSAEQSRLRGGYGQERYEKEQIQATVRDSFSKLVQDYWKVGVWGVGECWCWTTRRWVYASAGIECK